MKYFRNRKERILAATYEGAQDEAHCIFVSSKGLMKCCETHQTLPNDAKSNWPRRAVRTHKPGGLIYVHATALVHFARKTLPRITTPFVLVSGDCVWDINTDTLGQDVVGAILDHPQLVAWHVQNMAMIHPKLHAIPLGLDYHTLAMQRRPDWGPSASPRAQEDLLMAHRLRSRPLAERAVTGYSNWQFVLGNGDRVDVIKALPTASCFFEPRHLKRSESWQRNTEHMFTISPRGRGMDCHRTWEAILLGSVPVIPDLPINDLFGSLPVCVVQDWSTVTPGFLARERDRILDEEYDFAPVLLETWRRKMRGRDDIPELKMKFQAFMALNAQDLRDAIA